MLCSWSLDTRLSAVESVCVVAHTFLARHWNCVHPNNSIMGFDMTPYTLSLAVCTLLSVAALVRYIMLPRPIPGIPHEKASARRILGDAPDVSHRQRYY